MDSVDILEKLASIEASLIRLERELLEVAGRTSEVTDFINTMQQVVSAMSENPMFKAMGMGNLGGMTKQDIPKLPGM